jgi:dihydrodipicolinate synthase/N-acetylneuraminate lyase
MKVSDAPFARLQPYLATGLDVFVGAEGIIPQGLENGAVGAVSGVAAAFPEPVSALVRAASAERARLVESLRAALSEHSFQASVKTALGFRDVPVRPDVRAPLRPLTRDAVKRLRDEIERLIGTVPLAPSAPGLVRTR